MNCFDYGFADGRPWLMLPSASSGYEHPLKAIEAMNGHTGPRMIGTHTVTVRNAVAVLNVIGPILRYANSRYVSTEVLALDFRAALDNVAIKAIVLNIDSPGGEASGISELAETIYAGRSKKKVVAYIGGTGASAAYWIASAASQIVIDATALVGGIGAAAELRKPTGPAPIVSRNAPNKRPDLNTEKGRAVAAGPIDALGEFFAQRVARNLGVKPDQLLKMGDHGGTKVGAAAVKAGLAHSLGSLDGLVASLNAGRPFVQSEPVKKAVAPRATKSNPPVPAYLNRNAPVVTTAAPAGPDSLEPSVTTDSIWRQRTARRHQSVAGTKPSNHQN
ncbi:S49 family peptidase [Stutzerimonas stutzeri]|uniref:S49 family peptidase n=1 Tax=Stutzerimonas stutzeri TaxID=316 RepID=UPI001F3A8372|nr:S49 family peptidase [Stutzerimonas stutzeri]